MSVSKFHSFQSPTDGIELPEEFTNPFHYTPHPLCLLATKEVQAYLRIRDDWRGVQSFPFPFPPVKDDGFGGADLQAGIELCPPTRAGGRLHALAGRGMGHRAQLRDFQGAVQTDGYGVYDYFGQQPGVTLPGCMAHVRRKFTDAQSSHPAEAQKVVGYIRLLYELEANLKAPGATAEETVHGRQAKAIPIMDAMEAWMQAAKHCTPSGLPGKALDYACKLWPRLRHHADSGIFQIDNNAVERGQRPSVMGRRNYLFSKNDRGAEDNAVFYSLLESCRVVGINPLRWLTHTLGKLSTDLTDEQLEALLPYNYKKSQE